MTKIKNFRIMLRPREIARWLKNERKLTVTPELEAAIEYQIQDAKRSLQPAAVYTTLTRPIAEKTLSMSFPETAVAVSVLAVTLGSGLESERQAAGSRQDALQESLLAGVQQEALAQAIQFVLRLVQEQAKEEDCEMSAPVSEQDAPVLTPLATLLGIQRIGVDWDASGVWPLFARMAWTFWTPVGKNAPRKSDARAEKTAV
jgi:hypothetical protein